MEMGPPRLLSE